MTTTHTPTYTISRFFKDGEVINTDYVFTGGEHGGCTFKLWEAYGSFTRRTVTMNDGSGEYRRSSMKALRAAQAAAAPVGYEHVTVDGGVVEKTIMDAVDDGTLTLDQLMDLSVSEDGEPALAAAAEPEPAAEPTSSPADAQPVNEMMTEPEQQSDTFGARTRAGTLTVQTTRGPITAHVPYIGFGSYAVDLRDRQAARVFETPAGWVYVITGTDNPSTPYTEPLDAANAAFTEHLRRTGHTVQN